MRGVRRQEAKRRHAAGRWMEDGSLGAAGESVPDSAAERVVEANGSAYRALLDDAQGVDGGLPEVPEERWRSWLLGGSVNADSPRMPQSVATGAHRAGRRWERVEPDAGPVVVRAERSSSVAGRPVAPGRTPSLPAPRRRWRALVMVALGVVALGVALSVAGWHAQPAAWRPHVRVRSVTAGRAASRPSAVAVDEEV